jgi:hypothetical protein
LDYRCASAWFCCWSYTSHPVDTPAVLPPPRRSLVDHIPSAAGGTFAVHDSRARNGRGLKIDAVAARLFWWLRRRREWMDGQRDVPTHLFFSTFLPPVPDAAFQSYGKRARRTAHMTTRHVLLWFSVALIIPTTHLPSQPRDASFHSLDSNPIIWYAAYAPLHRPASHSPRLSSHVGR